LRAWWRFSGEWKPHFHALSPAAGRRDGLKALTNCSLHHPQVAFGEGCCRFLATQRVRAIPVPNSFTMMKITHPTARLLLLVFAALGFGHLSTPKVEAQGSYRKQLVRLHNAERTKRNRPEMRLHGALNRASLNYAGVMNANDHFDHTGPAPDFSQFDQRIRDAGGGSFSTMAENIAMGQRTPAAVTRAWMRSRSHRRNILNRRFTRVGFGKAGDPAYWVSNFGG